MEGTTTHTPAVEGYDGEESSVYRLAIAVQDRCARIKALAFAADEVLNGPELDVDMHDRVIRFVELINEQTITAKKLAEKIETRTYGAEA